MNLSYSSGMLRGLMRRPFSIALQPHWIHSVFLLISFVVSAMMEQATCVAGTMVLKPGC